MDEGLADQVVDPNSAEVEVTHAEDGAALSSNAMVPNAAYCTIDGHYTVTWTFKSYLGNVRYRWFHRTNYCRGGGKVRVKSHNDGVRDADFMIQVREVVSKAKSGGGTGQARAYMQRHLESCVIKYGCTASSYPWNRSFINANGTYRHEGSNK
ncbi:hypothetical protein [Nocardioides massiliensis]|uniref:Uncharacterized protein n=1 Tax=Nocardioides massiliensis TaxID=1325935 RepID=A0ABT9NRI9_9ACTN|nr:hypothetical protein [Nocardioides massiliensis]MDP9822931.1 hypothetical protein [Nocardioides massiliensis]